MAFGFVNESGEVFDSTNGRVEWSTNITVHSSEWLRFLGRGGLGWDGEPGELSFGAGFAVELVVVVAIHACD